MLPEEFFGTSRSARPGHNNPTLERGQQRSNTLCVWETADTSLCFRVAGRCQRCSAHQEVEEASHLHLPPGVLSNEVRLRLACLVMDILDCTNPDDILVYLERSFPNTLLLALLRNPSSKPRPCVNGRSTPSIPPLLRKPFPTGAFTFVLVPHQPALVKSESYDI